MAITIDGTGSISGVSSTGISAAQTVNASSITTGTLAVANGGTGASTLTANNVILGNGTSAPSFVAPGTNGNVLTSNGTTWTSAAAGGSPLVFLTSTTTGSSVATVNFTGLDATTYIAYMVEFQGVRPSTDLSQLRMRVGTSGGLLTGNDYNSNVVYSGTYTGATNLGAGSVSYFALTQAKVRSSTAGGCAGVIWFHQSVNATPSFTSSTSWWAPPDGENFQALAGGSLNSTYTNTAITRLTFFFDSGNITADSKITVYGLKAS